jgi:hypothetical protein
MCNNEELIISVSGVLEKQQVNLTRDKLYSLLTTCKMKDIHLTICMINEGVDYG